MRKHILLLAAVVLCHAAAHSQVDVFTNGNVAVKGTLSSSNTGLSVGDRSYSSSYSVYASSNNTATGCYNIAAEGISLFPSTTSGRAIGVRGVAGNNTDGWNFGVAGILQGSNAGAGVFGTATRSLGFISDGRYAGLVRGDMKVTGSAKVSWVNPHEQTISNTSSIQNALSIVNSLQPKQGTVMFATLTDDSLSIYPGHKSGQSSGTTHYGFSSLSTYISHPNLTIDDASGQHYVNYTDIMPLLVEAVKQLYAMASATAMAGGGMDEELANPSATPAMKAQSAGCRLLQIEPNPFTKATLVRYALPENTHDAWLRIADMQETPVREIPLDGSSDRVILSSSGLEPGMYLCTLVINGKDAEKRRVILTTN